METRLSERIILGCGNFGGVGSPPSLIGQGDSASQAHALLNQAVSLGIRHFDTANTYGGGESEKIIGDWIGTRANTERLSLKISTKVGNPFGCPAGQHPLSRQQIESHVDESLRRLRIEQIAVLYLHEADPQTPLDETLEALARVCAQGKVASFGLSNAGLQQIQTCAELAGAVLRPLLTHVQNEFHLLKTEDLAKLIPFTQQLGIHYVAFGALAGGILSGKYQSFSSPPQESRLGLRGEPYQAYLGEEGQKKIAGFLKNCAEQGKNPSEAALKFVLDTPGIESVIIGPRRREHYESLGFKFTAA